MSAIGSHSTATSTASWDGPGNEAKLSNDQGAATYRKAYAWADPAGDPDTKAAYKFIHHFIGAGGTVGAASTIAATTGIGVLNGGRGGTAIPGSDRSGVYAHLARHLRDANIEPPALRSDGPGPERRSYTFDQISLRAKADGLHFRGHAAVFGQRTWIGPPGVGFWEEVDPAAFDRAIREDDVRFLVDHDPSKVLARNSSGTLRLTKDKRGLLADADMADVSYARDLAVLLDRGDVSHMSFGFIPRQQDFETLDDGSQLRRLVDVELWDVSAVAYPAYDGTDAALRAVEARRADSRIHHLTELRSRLDAAWKGAEHE